MRGTEIRSLTGLRLAAALWVVAFHVVAGRPGNFRAELPAVDAWLSPLYDSGRLGVDLFFVLSGFVLALNYLPTVGERPRLDVMRRFWWARLSRVWPAYFVMISVAAGIDVVAAILLPHRRMPDDLTPIDFLEQMLLVQQWTAERHSGTSWNGPSWSVSAEAFAYLLFPLLAVLVVRLVRRAGTGVPSALSLAALSLATMVPLLLLMVGTQSFASPYSWTARILCEFVAGMLAYAAVAAVEWTPRRRRLAGWGSLLLALAVVGWLFAAPLAPLRPAWGLVCVLFVPLIGLLSVASGPLPRLLSTRAMVFGGRISYSLYLVHIPTFHLGLALGRQVPLVREHPELSVYVALGLVPVALVFAWLLYSCVEEPCRRRMRGMADQPRDSVPSHRPAAHLIRTQSMPADAPVPMGSHSSAW
jgi:peptidoglycan/LPS O-acetylase OafA/YrhL